MDEQKCLSYEHIVVFFSSKSKIVTVDAKKAESYRKKIQELNTDDFDVTENMIEEQQLHADENGQVQVALRLDAASYDGYRSAISFLYKETGLTMPVIMAEKLTKYLKGSKRINLAAKQTLRLKIVEGKAEMRPQVYSKRAQILFESEKIEHIFAHTFLVLEWNLMKRAENCVHANISHFRFHEDSLIFEFAKSKSLQDGESHVGPWHVYANPHQPHICPVLALARYLFMYPFTFAGGKNLFEGDDQYNRYSKIFGDVLRANSDEFSTIHGCSINELGTHSVRKGVAMLVASGCTVSPPIVSLCIRMGWSMGGVKERYLKYAGAGDEAVCRRANLSDPLSDEFAVSPPYFDFSSIQNEAEQDKKNRK